MTMPTNAPPTSVGARLSPALPVWLVPVLAVLALLLLANMVFTYRIAAQLNTVVQGASTSPLTTAGQPVSLADTAYSGFPSTQARGAPNPRFPNTLSTTPASRIQQLKQRAASIDPSKLAASETRLLAMEPSLPAVEQRNTGWLNTTLANLPDDLPRAVAPQASCQGRRCVIDAAFEDEAAAREWASRYLLAAGGRQLQNSRTLVLPMGNSPNQGVTLRLYLY